MARAAVEFEVYRDESSPGALIIRQPGEAIQRSGSGSWRWRARSRNGRIIADSGEGYSSRSAATKAVERLILNIATDEVRILPAD